jgi:hypothetical protein
MALSTHVNFISRGFCELAMAASDVDRMVRAPPASFVAGTVSLAPAWNSSASKRLPSTKTIHSIPRNGTNRRPLGGNC